MRKSSRPPVARAVTKQDQNYVSIWFWLLALLVLAVPLVNIVMTLVWAFAGENEARKNYFRAVIVMFFVMAGLATLFISAGLAPTILEKLKLLPDAKEEPARLPRHPSRSR